MSSGRSANCQPLDLERRLADADRHALAFLAAGADSRVELQVGADHADPGQRVLMIALLRRPRAWVGYWRYRGYLPR